MTMTIPDQIRGFALRYEEQEFKWNYYQNLLKENGYHGIVHALVHIDKLTETLKDAKEVLHQLRAMISDQDEGHKDAGAVIAKIEEVLK